MNTWRPSGSEKGRRYSRERWDIGQSVRIFGLVEKSSIILTDLEAFRGDLASEVVGGPEGWYQRGRGRCTGATRKTAYIGEGTSFRPTNRIDALEQQILAEDVEILQHLQTIETPPSREKRTIHYRRGEPADRLGITDRPTGSILSIT